MMIYQNWEVVKINNFEKFLGRLELENEFDRELINYLNAIKYVSEITVQNIDLLKTRECINDQLNIIVNFVKKYSEDYYEIGLIKGFKVNEKDNNGNWKIDGRDYYYYIADQKMKASVYYVRYVNYINTHLDVYISAEEELKGYILEIQSKCEEDVKISKDNIISIFDDFLEQTDENHHLRQRCIECIEKIRAKDIKYIEYMLFNNMMKEIRYIGAAYQYLWHWEMKMKNLFRSVSYDSNEIIIEYKFSKKIFLQKMFNNVISHMNISSKELCSYSEDPYIDIFKYLKIQKNDKKEYYSIYSSSDIDIEIENLENQKKARFDIIKRVMINSIYRNGVSKSFYDFLQDENKITVNDSLAYAVELYPDLPERDKNSKNTSKNIKNLLLLYLSTWVDNKSVNRLMSYVADDKEVVTRGKIESDMKVITNNNIPAKIENGIRYEMELDKNELIYLLLKIRNNINIENITKRFKVDLYMYGVRDWIRDVINGKTKDNRKIKGKILQYITENKSMSIDIKCELSPSFIYKIDNPNPTLETYENKIIGYIENNIKKYFTDRYRNILEEKHDIADFILNFISDERYKCPPYIKEYNEYTPEQGDAEISILKYLIFKG